ncbi:MAG: PD40 domain-containing protein, partial [Sedimentisphaerales bacterium]|nr:PD40 domain-containing protein [Sedimentisphaerales bacterium]
GPFRSGGLGNVDMWMSRRMSISDPWGTPVNLGPIVNTSSLDGGPRISFDGSTLYFASERPGGYGGEWGDVYQSQIIPIVDLNGDRIVDAEDMVIMIDNWGTDNSLCDIGPMPWGDGVVDVQDLIVLAEHLFEKLPGRPNNP